jgi:hypothetical protein
MNSVGKTLVVLNLLFALAAGGFLVIDYAKRTNYRDESEHRGKLAQVSSTNAQVLFDTNRKLVDEIKKLRADNDQLLINQGAKESELVAEIKRIEKEYLDQKRSAEKAILVKEQMIEEAKRLQGEVQLLNGVVAKREKAVLDLQEDIKKYINEAKVQSEYARAAQERGGQLLTRVVELEKKLAKYIQGTTTTGTTTVVTSPNYHNPPPAYIKGRILKIDATDRKLVTVSVGSDVGVNKDNTLEVYRLRPEPEYLGRLLIREAYPNQAIGRLMKSGGVERPLMEGDEVASTTARP